MQKKKTLPIYFILGTRAQFIKVAPVMREMLDQGLEYTLIYTAQHQENIQEILAVYDLPAPTMVMYDRGEANTKGSFLLWFLTILYKSLFQANLYVPKPGILLTHGDTFTAWLAALIGKRASCIVGHIESGCRSFNIFSPFPEEISRLITFNFTDIFFCADEWTFENVKRYKGRKINMGANTMLDGVRYALDYPPKTHLEFEDRPFALISVHRFENIFTPRLTEIIIPTLLDMARDHDLIFTLHPATRERLRALGLYERLSGHPHITLHERFGFIDWIRVCSKAEFVITDGGSNQEELSYLGVPTLLFRNETERREGLGENVVLSKFDKEIIFEFTHNANKYRKKPMLSLAQPSKEIVAVISED